MITRRTVLVFAVLLVAGSLPQGARTAARQAPEDETAQSQAAAEGSLLSAKDAHALERKLAEQPDDLLLRSQLLGYYLLHQAGDAHRVRQQHIVWLIRHAPAAWITGSPEALLTPPDDNAVQNEARHLWEQQVQRNPANARVLGNAATFFIIPDEKRAEQLFRQAQTLEPTSPRWAAALGNILYGRIAYQTGMARRRTAQQALAQFETWDKYADAADKSGDYSALADMAMSAFEARAFDTARQYAERLLAIAAHDPTAGNSIQHGNIVLGRLALHDGDTAKACTYLLAAGRTPGSAQLDSFGPNMTLAKELLETGERTAVLDYFKLCARFWKERDLKEWAAQVKQGEMPDFGANLVY